MESKTSRFVFIQYNTRTARLRPEVVFMTYDEADDRNAFLDELGSFWTWKRYANVLGEGVGTLEYDWQ